MILPVLAVFRGPILLLDTACTSKYVEVEYSGIPLYLKYFRVRYSGILLVRVSALGLFGEPVQLIL